MPLDEPSEKREGVFPHDERPIFEIIPLSKNDDFFRNLIKDENPSFPTTGDLLKDAAWILVEKSNRRGRLDTFVELLERFRIACIPTITRGDKKYTHAFNVPAGSVELNGEVLVNNPVTGAQTSKITNAALASAHYPNDGIEKYLGRNEKGVYILNPEPV